MNHCHENNFFARWLLNMHKTVRNLVVKVFLVIVASFSLPAFSALPYCTDIFFAGLITHGGETKIKFERNAQLLGSESRAFATKIIADYYSPKRTCGEYFCRSSSQLFPDPILLPQKNTFSTNDVVVKSKKKKILSNKSAYGRINVWPNANLAFAPRAGGYTVYELNLEHKSKLQLVAGEYWIGDLNLHEGAELDVIGEGTAILYITENVSIPKNFRINGKTKDPAKLIIYTFGKVSLESHAKINAFIYALGDVNLGKKANVNGALIARNIRLGSDSKVTFVKEDLQHLNFADNCSGAPPSRDIIGPDITLDPFPYNTQASSITITGTVTDPDNGVHWVEGASLIGVSYPFSNEKILFDDNGRFSIELPLTGTINYFQIEAIDKFYNRTNLNFTVRRETNVEFAIHLDLHEIYQLKPMPVSGTVTAPEGTTIASVFIRTPDGDTPLTLVNNRFSVILPLALGFNQYLIVARDDNGNEISQDIFIEGLSGIAFEQVRAVGNSWNPEHKMTGFFYALWPLEEMSLFYQGVPQVITQVGEHLYEFSIDIVLHDGRSRHRIEVATPDGIFGEEDGFIFFYSPDRIFLTVENWNLEQAQQAVKITGTLHIPLELIRDNMSLVVTNDRFAGIEYLVTTLGLNKSGNAEFAIDVPLASGSNNLTVKVKKGSQDAVIDIGVERFEFQVMTD